MPRRPRRLTVTARIALLAVALALASNLLLAAVVWTRTHDDAIGAVRREAAEQRETLAAVWRAGGRGAVAAAVDEAAAADPELVVALFDHGGRARAGSAPDRWRLPARATGFRVAPSPAGAVGYALAPLGRDWLVTGRMLASVEEGQRMVERALLVAMLVSVVLGAGAGAVIARYVAARLDRIAAVADAAREGDLSARVGAPGGGDAFDRLGVRIDAMLVRVERLMEELRLVSDGLAHDLRSPLARLHAKAEQAALAPDAASREAALAGLMAESGLVMRMLATLIEIGRSGATPRDRLAAVRPAALVGEVAELYAPVVEEAGRAFALVADATLAAVPLHRELMSQAIANLLDNTLKHGAGAVTLRLARVADGIAIAVEDRGAGIAEVDRAAALRRFGRLDAARSVPGAGLGTALVEAVARLHDGRFELADNAPGLVARIVLPAADV